MNDNISINDLLKNAAERASKKAEALSEQRYNSNVNWSNYPKSESETFDLNKATEALTKKVNNFSSTMSVKFAESVEKLNDHVNGDKKDERNSSFTVDDMKDSFRKMTQKARENETIESIGRTLNEYRNSISEALDESSDFTVVHVNDTDGSQLFLDIQNSHLPVVVSGKEKGRVVQELSDAARQENIEIEQIPMILKDDISLRRLISEVRENSNKNRVVVLDIAESPNAEQLRIFDKFVNEAKNGNFYLVVLSDDEFSNSWFIINGAIQRVYDF